MLKLPSIAKCQTVDQSANHRVIHDGMSRIPPAELAQLRCITMPIEPYQSQHLDTVIQLSLKAWAPVFDSLQNVMNPAVYRAFYANGWRASQAKAVAEACTSAEAKVWVAVEAESTVGFVAAKLHEEDSMGEIYMVAVDPDWQGRGIGSALIDHALDWMKTSGMAIAMVETGGDPGHAPARYAYEKAGFELLPIARYFKSLSGSALDEKP